jgi:hypothetical protein
MKRAEVDRPNFEVALQGLKPCVSRISSRG